MRREHDACTTHQCFWLVVQASSLPRLPALVQLCRTARRASQLVFSKLREDNSNMQQAISHVALIVRDYDEALDFYVGKLGFKLLEDAPRPEQNKRWVVIAPPGTSRTSLLLARASSQEQAAFIGNQSGGRVFLFLQTDDFWRDYNRMVAAGITFMRPPTEEPYGTVAVFQDLYGNLWDLVQYSGSSPYGLGAT